MTLKQLICVWLIFIPKWTVSQGKISQDDFIGDPIKIDGGF